MATHAEVRRIALSFAQTREQDGHFAFEVFTGRKWKGFAWVWMERVRPKKPRVANTAALAVRVPGLDAKEMLLLADPGKFFTEPHYDGFPAVLVRLAAISRAELRPLLRDAWATQAPKALLREQGGSARSASARGRKAARTPRAPSR
jgi:hypothetical protein